MKRLMNTAASLLAFSTMLALPSVAKADCIPNPLSDGGENLCLGTDSLNSNYGYNNTAVGAYALYANTNGSSNTAVGSGALGNNVGAGGNTAIGSAAMSDNTSGLDNTASGASALASNTSGLGNTANGNSALLYNQSGGFNTGMGINALFYNTGSNNVALGASAGYNLTSGSNNVAIANSGVAGEGGTIRIGTQGTQTRAFVAGISGVSISGGQTVVVNSNGQLGIAAAVSGTSNSSLGGTSLSANTTGDFNTAAGNAALRFNTSGSKNTASGAAALRSNTRGDGNTATGVGAMSFNTRGSFNTSMGLAALRSNTTGNRNVALGVEAATAQTTGSANVAIGFRAGANWTVGDNNISISNPGLAEDNKTIRIGVKGQQARTFIAGIRNTTLAGGLAVLVNADGKLGVATSSRRYKEDIQPMGDASNPLLQLRPVTFRYKQAEEDGTHPLQYGLIAEEVAAVMPELAVYNTDGTPESVAYQVLPSLLLNEYQKQAKELAAEKAGRLTAEARLAALETEMATMKLMIAKLASAQSEQLQFAAAP